MYKDLVHLQQSDHEESNEHVNEPSRVTEPANHEDIQQTSNQNAKEKEKCKECEYQTNKPRLLRGHKIAHTGQYQCQQGCKAVFKTFGAMDEHIKSEHTQTNAVSYDCEQCGVQFSAIFHLRKHVSNKHAQSLSSAAVDCELCG